VSPEYKNCNTQSDHLRDPFAWDSVLSGYPKGVTVAVGPSQYVEANIGYEEEAAEEDPIPPVISTVGSKVLEQCLLESAEEYEIQQVQFEIRKLINKRLMRQARAAKLIDNEVVKAEQRMAEKVMTDQQMRVETEAEQNLGAALFSTQICSRAMDESIYKLQKMNFLHDTDKELASTFQPWCNKKILQFINIPRMMVDNVIKNVTRPPKLMKSETYVTTEPTVTSTAYDPETVALYMEEHRNPPNTVVDENDPERQDSPYTLTKTRTVKQPREKPYTLAERSKE